MACRDTCQILLQKLKEGQEDLRNSLIELQPHEEVRTVVQIVSGVNDYRVGQVVDPAGLR